MERTYHTDEIDDCDYECLLDSIDKHIWEDELLMRQIKHFDKTRRDFH